MIITVEELARLRRKINDPAQLAFSDPELDDIWVEAEENLSKAIFLCLEELTTDAVRFSDYTQNETQEKKSQVFDHLAKTRDYFAAKVAAENTAGNTSRIIGTKVIPRRVVERPYTDPDMSDTEFWR